MSSMVFLVLVLKRIRLCRSSISYGPSESPAKSTVPWSVSVSHKVILRISLMHSSEVTTPHKSSMVTVASRFSRTTRLITNLGLSLGKVCSTTENTSPTFHTLATQPSSTPVPRNLPCHHLCSNRCKQSGRRTSQTSSANLRIHSATFSILAPMLLRN